MIGRTLSTYRVLARLGAGGMGEVYCAHDEKLDRNVALKVLPPGLLDDDNARSRFRKEAKALSRLSHPHVATLLDFGNADGVDYLVMELVPGPTLAEVLRKGPLTPKEVVRLGTQLARGLQAAHEQGIVHRDLKPSNLCLTGDGLLKILDFGLAHLKPAPSSTSQDETPTETAAGKVVGSPPYMSPEQLLGRDVDARSDVYSAGACLYELATARRPYGDRSGAALTDAILHETPVPVSRVSAQAPPGLDSVIAKAMDKDPGLRYQTATELVVDLERLQPGSEVSQGVGAGTSTAGQTPLRRPGWRWAVAVGAALGVAAAVWFLRPPQAPRITNVRPLLLDLGWLSETGVVSTWATDGVRLYYVARRQDGYRLFQVPMTGGAPSEIAIPESFGRGLEIYAYLPKQSALLCLALTEETEGTQWPVLIVPVPKGAPYRLADLTANGAAISPDGMRIVLTQIDKRRLLIANADGSGARTLRELPVQPWLIFWAPDGKTLRFSAFGPLGHESEPWIWETNVGGDAARALWPGRSGGWTPDGRHFVAERWNELARRFDLFAVREARWPLWSHGESTPLTNGPGSFFHAGPRPDGKGWFAFGTDQKGELQRFDRPRGRFEPFLGGKSIGYVDPSPDGEWLAWISFPDEILWKGRRDGSESFPLTSAPLRAWMPRWSPDGKWLLFVGVTPGEPRRAVRLVPAGGGATETLARPEEGGDLWDPCWLPDGHSIVFGDLASDPAAELRTMDLRTRAISVFPGSVGLHYPKCGPQGQILAWRMPNSHYVVWWPERGGWEGVGPARGVYPTWTRDGRSFCALAFSWSVIECYSFATRRYETVAELRETRVLPWVERTPWFGLDLDGSPMVMRDISTTDLYALDWEAP